MTEGLTEIGQKLEGECTHIVRYAKSLWLRWLGHGGR